MAHRTDKQHQRSIDENMASPTSLVLMANTVLCMSPELLNPSPDWTLQDLKEELDALSMKFKGTHIQEHTPPASSYRFSWRELSVAADFGRVGRPFRICAFDDSSDTEDDEPEYQPASQQRETSAGTIVAKPCETPSKLADTGAVLQTGAPKNKYGSAPGVSPAAECNDKPWLLRKLETAEGIMLELEYERLQRVQEEVRQRRFILETLIEEESMKAAVNIEQVIEEEELKKEMAHRTDKQHQRSIAELRDTHLSALQREHEQRSQIEEKKIRREAEARQREIQAREEQERQERLKAEAETKRREDAKHAAEAERRKQAEAEAALQRAERERLAKEAEAVAAEQVAAKAMSPATPLESRTVSEPKPMVSKTASELEHARHTKMLALLEASQSLQENASLKKVLKDQERNLIKYLTQVTATQDQVRKKSMNLMNELASSAYQAFSLTTFAAKLMSQCENQVLKLPSFAFALAQVVVTISAQIPEVMDVVIATMNQACIFTVPKYYVFKQSQFENDRAYFKACGYRECEGKLESTDDYAARMAAYVTLYAAIMQAEIEGGINPHGLKESWAWCARLLNSLPADRLTASALEAFLKVSGFRLCQVYPKSFMKMLRAIAVDFIGSLKQQNDPDARAAVSRLETYIATQQYLKEPEGFRMPRTDLSSSYK